MLETSARLLRLLSLLQARRDWTSTELATRLGVTTRTIRNDMDRLRGLGYPVNARPGVAGGYRLGTGGALPPLLLDDEEAVAVAIGLRTAASGSIAGIEETSVRALAKLQQMLPPRLRHKVSAFQSSALPVPSRGPQVDPDVLTVIASACRDHEQLRFDYRAHSGAPSQRSVEPYRLINDRRRWYLVAWDTDRDAWRTFRADRIQPQTPAGPRFTPRALPPDPEIAAQVARGIGEATWRYRARVIVHAPAAHVRGQAADPRSGGIPGRGPVRVRAGLRPPGDARPLPGNAGRGLHHRGLAGAGGRAAQADNALPARHRRQPAGIRLTPHRTRYPFRDPHTEAAIACQCGVRHPRITLPQRHSFRAGTARLFGDLAALMTSQPSTRARCFPQDSTEDQDRCTSLYIKQHPYALREDALLSACG